MSAKDTLGGKTDAPPAGESTKLSGYVNTPIPKKCGTCEYLKDKRLCTNKTVLDDKQVPTDPTTKLKIVSAKNGCCNLWHHTED